jgi:hypothetical protein
MNITFGGNVTTLKTLIAAMHTVQLIQHLEHS